MSLQQSIRIYMQGAKVAIASRMAYRADFFISFAMMLLIELIAPLITIVIYSHGMSFPGWKFEDIIFIQSIFLLVKGISFPFFFGIVWNSVERVRDGTLDILLLRPVSGIFILIVTGFDAEDLGKLTGGILIFSYALSQITIPNPFHWIYFILLVISAILTFFAFALIMSGITISAVATTRLYEIFDSLISFGQYPTEIFPKLIRYLLITVLPLSLAGFLPASILLGKVSPTQIIIAPLSGIIFLLFAFWFWNHMIRRYNSAGG